MKKQVLKMPQMGSRNITSPDKVKYIKKPKDRSKPEGMFTPHRRGSDNWLFPYNV